VDNLAALVTGANKGIGKEIARQFADTGLTVYLGSRDPPGPLVTGGTSSRYGGAATNSCLR